MHTKQKFNRRTFLSAAAVMGTGLVFGPSVFAQSAGRPLKIGMITSLSGPFAALGESMRTGLQLLIAESGGQFAGRNVVLIVEDDQVKPDEGVRKARKLVSQDNVDMICGVISSAVALAIRDVVAGAKVPTFITTASANDLARKAMSPYVFRPAKTNWMLGHTAGLWSVEKISRKGCITLAADYAAGREYVGDFIAAYKAGGGEVKQEIWTPLGTTDFAPLMTTLAAEKPDFVYSFFAGSDAVRFHQAMRDFGLAGKVKVVGTGALFDQEDVLPVVGDAAIGGIHTFHSSPTASNPANRKFVDAYLKLKQHLPGENATAGYATGQVMKAAAERVQGDLSNKDKLRDALLASPVETVYGSTGFDPRNNQAILDIHVNEVRKGSDGKPINTVIHTYKLVRDPGPAA